MTVVRLTDAIVPDVFLTYMVKDTMTKSAIFASGVLAHDEQMGSKLSGGGLTFQVPFWKDLTDTEAHVVDDDPAHTITADKVGTAKMIGRRQYRAYSWGDMDLVKELAGSDPMQRISGRVTDWWNRQFQVTLVSTLKGVFADNTANDTADMTYDISANSGTDAMVSADAILEAAQTLGDASGQLSVIVMHSRVYTNLAKQNLIDFIPNSEGKVRFPTYLGYYVIVDDGVQKDTSGSDITYSTYLLGPGAIAWSESPPAVPVETFRYPDQGYGAGAESLFVRRQYLMHPYGFKWTDSSVAGSFPTNAELATAANWDRVFPERKQVPIARLLTKNG